MKFTNVTHRGLYFQCCHREVEPGGSFFAPWLSARHDRAVRSAMADGSLAWESGNGEPHVPGSRKLPTAQERDAALARRKAEAAERRRADEEAMQRRMAEDNAGVSANMARMGHFDVPKPIPRRAPAQAVAAERPVTREDIIRDDRPQSLAAIVRHNRAIRIVERTRGGDAGTNPSKDKGKKES